VKQIEVPTVKPELRTMILDALKRAYVSASSKDGTETGNHYQSVTLGDEQSSGFRSDRATFLDQIDFHGKRVLDLGSNLGEISRAARARGAAIVDGYEYDPFFVELAQAVNAFNGTTRVSFYERDITDPQTYRERYDIVLAFSVFTYIHGVLDCLAQMTDEALVIETHKLEGNLERDYLTPVCRFMPVYKILGKSDWGRSLPDTESRAVLVFARDKPTLERALGRGGERRRRTTWVSPQRTMLQRRFFERVSFPTSDGLLSRVRKMDFDLPAVADDPDLAKSVYSGELYWLIFLRGYCQYLDEGVLGRGNLYFDYFTQYHLPRRHDPALSDALSDPVSALERVTARFYDMNRFRRAPHTYVPPAITIFRVGNPDSDRLEVYETDSGEAIHAHAIDGWHRLFAARVFGARTIPAEVFESPTV
jgi:SAM-dependent methyltransferase